MFLTVTPNTALDVTYEVTRLGPGATHRVDRPRARAGGKGVNVARVLHALGEAVHVIGFAGGQAGEAVEGELTAAGVPATLVPVAGETRRTVAVVETTTGMATLFNEPGPAVTAPEWHDFVGCFGDLARRARAVVLSGSLPPGLPVDAYAVLIRAAGTTPVLLDADGQALQEGARARPVVVKPNAEELTAATGHSDPGLGAAALRDMGAGTVVVSQGAAGLTAFTDAGVWRARPPESIIGNPTGAGDAAVAALARGMAAATSWPDLLRDAVALSAAAVAAPVAGQIDHETYVRLRPLIRISPPSPGLPAGPATPPSERKSR